MQPPAAHVSPGAAVRVAVQAQAPAGGLGAWGVVVTYDPAVLQIGSDGCVEASGSVCNPAITPTTISIIGASPAGQKGTVLLATLTFEASGPAGSATPLTLTIDSFTDSDGNGVATAVGNGSVSVGP
ncbi:MAG: cohesin domain-containing protein [Dehalococcoidia bacterium]